jgi:RNA polymerase sigma factor (sigma-70 family)
MRQARFHSRRPQDGEDALNDACVQFLRFYEVRSDQDDPLPWMLLVVKRCAWAIARRAKNRETPFQLTDTEWIAGELTIVAKEERIGPAQAAERSEETARLIALIERLKPDERTALILFGLGCSYAEIAELRGWTMTKVNRCIAEGRARVRELLERGVS